MEFSKSLKYTGMVVAVLATQGGIDMQWLYVLLMFLVMIFTVYETVGYYREYKRSKTRRDQVNFFVKIGVLVVLIVLFVWMINQVIDIGTGMIGA